MISYFEDVSFAFYKYEFRFLKMQSLHIIKKQSHMYTTQVGNGCLSTCLKKMQFTNSLRYAQ